MQSFTITTHLHRNEYIRLILKRLYKSWFIRIASTIGILLLITALLQTAKLIDWYPGKPVLQLFFGIFTLLLPIMTLSRAGSLYSKTPKLSQPAVYTFTEEGFRVKGSNFNQVLGWRQVTRTEEIDHYLLLYSSDRAAEILNKNNLSAEQLDFIFQHCRG